jgi:hypothetical protein
MMVGHLDDVAGFRLGVVLEAGLEGGGEGAVPGATILRKHALVENLGEQRMDEPVALVRGAMDNAAFDAFAKDPADVAIQPRRDRELVQEVDRCRASSHRDEPGEVTALRGQPVPGTGDGLPQVGRKAGGRPVGVRVQSAGQQDGEVRVAAGPAVHVVHERLSRGTPEQVGELLGGRRPVQAVERDLGEAGQAARLGEPAVQGVTVGDLAGPQGQYDGEPPPGRQGDRVQQHVERALVGPLQVVHHQEDRPRAARLLQPRVERERVQSGDPAAVRRLPFPDRRGQRQERHCQRRQRQTRCPQHAEGVADRANGLLDDRGLADACFAGDQQRTGPAVGRTGQQAGHDSQFAGPSHEPPAVPIGARHRPSLPAQSRSVKARTDESAQARRGSALRVRVARTSEATSLRCCC